MNITLKVLSIVCLAVAIGILLVSCRNLMKPVDGPGMERDSADFANEVDSEKAQAGAKTAGAQDGANAIYEPRIKDGAVYRDFNMEQRENPGACSLDGCYGSNVAGHGQVLFYTNLKLCIEADVDFKSVEEPAVLSMMLDYNKEQLSLPVPSGEALKVERLYNNPWDWGCFQNKE